MISLARRRLRGVEARASEQSSRIAALYFPDFRPAEVTPISPPPDFAAIDAEEAARERDWGDRPLFTRRAFAISLGLHALILAPFLVLWSEAPAPRPQDTFSGMSVTLVDQPPAARVRADAMREEIGANPRAAAGASRVAALADFDIPSEPGAIGVPVVSPQAASPPKPPSMAQAKDDSGPGMPNVAAPANSRADPRSLDEERWEGAIVGRLEKKKRYPKAAMRLGGDDVVMLRITIDRQGRLLLAEIAKSKGIAELDAEALALASRASPYPVPPPTVQGDAIRMVVPIEFIMKKAR